MAYTVTEIDKYLKSHKYDFYQLITKGWGAKDKDVIEIKNLWQDAEDAVGTNSKLNKFKKLQEKLNPFFDRAKDRLKKDEETLKENNALSFPDPTDQADHDFDKSLVKFAEWPKANKFENLTLEDAYGDEDGGKPYDNEQMTKLAEQYGYDYRDKDERKEFLSYVSKAHQNRELEKIWNDDIYAGLVTPIAKEYAQKNYEKINEVKDILPAVAADVGVGTLMAGIPGSTVTNKAVGAALDNTIAPLARQAARVGLNDVPIEDAAKDAVSEIATNIATPVALKTAYRWGNRAVTPEKKRIAAKIIDNAANDVRATFDKIKNGGIITQKMPKGDDKIYLTWKNGKFERVPASEVGKNPEKFINAEEAKKFWNNLHLLRDKSIKERFNKSQMKSFEEDLKDLPKAERKQEMAEIKKLYDENADNRSIEALSKNAKELFQKNLDADKKGEQLFEGMNPYQVAAVTQRKPKETIWNWASQSQLANDAGAYLTNQQGRSKYGGAMLQSVSRLDPTNTLQSILSNKPIVDQEDPEVKMYKRNYILYQANPDLINKPKKPEKYKDFTVEEIFGE